MSFELFRFDAAEKEWLLVREMNASLPLLQKDFRLGFDDIPEPDILMRVAPRDSDSLVLSFLLEPRSTRPVRSARILPAREML